MNGLTYNEPKKIVLLALYCSQAPGSDQITPKGVFDYIIRN
jgi:hypothetical protein